MPDSQQFRIAMNDVFTQVGTLEREYPLRVRYEVTNGDPEEVACMISMGLFPIASLSFSFEFNSWILERNQQAPLIFPSLAEAITQIKKDYESLLKDLTKWKAYGTQWKDII